MNKINFKFEIFNLKFWLGLLFAGLFLSSVSGVFAHAIVKPDSAGIGSFTDFSLGVPSEKDASTVGVKLILPPGLGSISPIVKPGWQVEVKNGPIPSGVTVQPDDDGNLPTSIPVEIDWTGGSIPNGQKDYFQFSAQVPAKETVLDWKVTQTYSDGSTVSWSLGPNDPQPKDSAGKIDTSSSGPYSKTLVVNDLNPTPNPVLAQSSSGSNNNNSMTFNLVAIVLSALALGLGLFKREKTT